MIAKGPKILVLFIIIRLTIVFSGCTCWTSLGGIILTRICNFLNFALIFLEIDGCSYTSRATTLTIIIISPLPLFLLVQNSMV